MRTMLLGAAVALCGLVGTAGKADAQVYFGGPGGFYNRGFSFGVGNPGFYNPGFYNPAGRFNNPYFGGFNPRFGYGNRSFYSTPNFGYRRPYDGFRGGGYYGGYYGRRWR